MDATPGKHLGPAAAAGPGVWLPALSAAFPCAVGWNQSTATSPPCLESRPCGWQSVPSAARVLGADAAGTSLRSAGCCGNMGTACRAALATQGVREMLAGISESYLLSFNSCPQLAEEMLLPELVVSTDFQRGDTKRTTVKGGSNLVLSEADWARVYPGNRSSRKNVLEQG